MQIYYVILYIYTVVTFGFNETLYELFEDVNISDSHISIIKEAGFDVQIEEAIAITISVTSGSATQGIKPHSFSEVSILHSIHNKEIKLHRYRMSIFQESIMQ